MTNEQKLLLTERQAAQRLGLSRRTLYGLRVSERIGYVPVGKTGVYYLPEQLDQWIASTRKDVRHG